MLDLGGATQADPAGLTEALARIASMVRDMKTRIRMLEAVTANFPGGISLFDERLRLVLCNDEQKRLLEYPPELFAGEPPSLEDLFRFNAARGEYGPGDPEEQVAERMNLARKRLPHLFERTRPNGLILEIRGVPLEGGGFLTTYLDVTEQRRNQRLIAHMAHHDPLTDLPNRTLFADRLQNAVALARRGAVMAVHYLDVDGFKPVNDRHGHQAGDELLVAIAHRLSKSVRDHDTVARLGGDEFAVIQTGINSRKDAEVLALRMSECFARPFRIGETMIQVGVSIGAAVAPFDARTPETLLAAADAALYRSKNAGRGCFTFAEPAEDAA